MKYISNVPQHDHEIHQRIKNPDEFVVMSGNTRVKKLIKSDVGECARVPGPGESGEKRRRMTKSFLVAALAAAFAISHDRALSRCQEVLDR